MAQNQGGLYGATRSAGGRDKLNIETWLSEAFTRGLPQEFQPFVPVDEAQAAEPSTMFSASVDYARIRRRFQLLGTLASDFRYAKVLDGFDVVSHHGTLQANFRLPSNGNLRIGETVTYAPRT